MPVSAHGFKENLPNKFWYKLKTGFHKKIKF